MPITRKRSAANKVYLPENTRENQYILAEFELTSALICELQSQPLEHAELSNIPQAQSEYANCYQKLSKLIFQLCDQYQIGGCLFIANDKLVRIRYHEEMHHWQTNQQIIFYYNPKQHKTFKAIYDEQYQAQKITLAFLATGLDLRLNAAQFHQKVANVLGQFQQRIQLPKKSIRFRDHQHLTYDLFSRAKTNQSNSQAHKLRTINIRYKNQQVEIPKAHSAMSYAIVTLPITQQIEQSVHLDLQSSDPYNPLYTYLTDQFALACKKFNLNNGALIANGLIPIIRFSESDAITTKGELQMLGYNPQQNPCSMISRWNAKMRADNFQLIFVANQENCDKDSFAKFLNQIEHALHFLAQQLALQPTQDEVIVRFHQHIGFNL